jgi:hypothetical protein
MNPIARMRACLASQLDFTLRQPELKTCVNVGTEEQRAQPLCDDHTGEAREAHSAGGIHALFAFGLCGASPVSLSASATCYLRLGYRCTSCTPSHCLCATTASVCTPMQGQASVICFALRPC